MKIKKQGSIVNIFIIINLIWMLLFGVNAELHFESHSGLISGNAEHLFYESDLIEILGTAHKSVSIFHFCQAKTVSYCAGKNEWRIMQYGTNYLTELNCFVYLTFLILNLEQLSERYKKLIEFIHKKDGRKNIWHLFQYN
ncbi:MAG: hypothetical protein UH211_01580 [Agathobacter sp.]|nr:hypothetical protein [Agathobacter sp.]